MARVLKCEKLRQHYVLQALLANRLSRQHRSDRLLRCAGCKRISYGDTKWLAEP